MIFEENYNSTSEYCFGQENHGFPCVNEVDHNNAFVKEFNEIGKWIVELECGKGI